MSVTKAQLVGGVGISTVGDLSVYGGVNVSGVSTFSNTVVGGASTELVVNGDVSVGVDTSQGVILTSTNGTRYRLIVGDDGSLSTTSV